MMHFLMVFGCIAILSGNTEPYNIKGAVEVCLMMILVAIVVGFTAAPINDSVSIGNLLLCSPLKTYFVALPKFLLWAIPAYLWKVRARYCDSSQAS